MNPKRESVRKDEETDRVTTIMQASRMTNVRFWLVVVFVAIAIGIVFMVANNQFEWFKISAF